MGNRINLDNFDIHTDLIIDNYKFNDEDKYVKYYTDSDIKVTNINVNNDNYKSFNRKIGNYITIEFPDISNFEDRERLELILENEIEKMILNLNIKKDDNCLIVGLGNRNSTPDSLGPKILDNIMITRHLFILAPDNVNDGIRCVSGISPGVMADTGIESADMLLDIVNDIKPKFIVIVDALASSSIDRINKTIQITDTGIHPGSGIGNNRKEISIDTLGIPVIAIGVPTVVDVSTVIGDTIKYLYKHISYIKNNFDKNKLILSRTNYFDKIKDIDLTDTEKKSVWGLLGELSNVEVKSLFNEVLDSINCNMMVTVKEIDFIIDKLSLVISSSINNALHDNVTHY